LDRPWRRWKDVIAALLPKPKMPEFVTGVLNDQCEQIGKACSFVPKPKLPQLLSQGFGGHCEQLRDQGKAVLKHLNVTQMVGVAMEQEAKQLESMGLESIRSAVGPERARILVQVASAEVATLTAYLRNVVKAHLENALISKACAVIDVLKPADPRVQEHDEARENIQAALSPVIERIAAASAVADSVTSWLKQAMQLLGMVAAAPEVEEQLQSPVIKILLASQDDASASEEKEGEAAPETMNITTDATFEKKKEPLALRLADQFRELPGSAAAGAEVLAGASAGGLEELRPAYDALATVHGFVSMVGRILGEVEGTLQLAAIALSTYEKHDADHDGDHVSDHLAARAQVSVAVQGVISDFSSTVLDKVIDALSEQVEDMMKRLLSRVGADATDGEAAAEEEGAAEGEEEDEDAGLFGGLVFSDVSEAELPDECSEEHIRRVLLALVMFDQRTHRYSD
jgi:hypothetical protein